MWPLTRSLEASAVVVNEATFTELKTAFFGANTVKGPGSLSVSVNPASLINFVSVDNCGVAAAVSTIDCGPGAAVAQPLRMLNF